MYFVTTHYYDTVKDFDPFYGWWAFAPTLEEARKIGEDFLLCLNYDCNAVYILSIEENSLKLIFEGFVSEPEVYWADMD